MAKRTFSAGLTKECMERIMAGEVEHIEIDADTELVIQRSPQLPKGTVGVRGPGIYIFTEPGA